VCPKGFYEASTAAATCTRCPSNSYCPGGDKVENPLSRGAPVLCGTNMVTRNSGARSMADCVSPAGYAQTSPGNATTCKRSEYAPAYNRLAKCLRCQSGLEEPLTSNLTDGARSSKRAVCSECACLDLLALRIETCKCSSGILRMLHAACSSSICRRMQLIETHACAYASSRPHKAF
jgi:hypothetical protein